MYAKIDDFTKAYAQSKYGKEMDSTSQRYLEAYEKGGPQGVVDAMKTDVILKGIAQETGGEDASVTKKMREVYAKDGADAVRNYSDAYQKIKNANDGDVNIQTILNYAHDNKGLDQKTMNALLPANSKGTFVKQNGEWVYRDQDGKVSKTANNTPEGKASEANKKIWANMGLDKTSSLAVLEKAVTVLDTLSPQQIAKEYKQIDADGNQGIKQSEMVDYFNQNGMSADEVNKYWQAFGRDNWKQIPVLVKGKWVLKKK